MSKVRFLAKVGAASIALAMALTFSCSSDSNSNNAGYTGNYGSLTYQGQTYKTVVIGTQTWMAENLNYDVSGSECYDNDPANCVKYGRLYSWDMAMQGICPPAWHLPSNDEWEQLINYVNSYKGCIDCAGKYLKAENGWNKKYWDGSSGDGTNDFGFSALPGGVGDLNDGIFHNIVNTFSAIGGNGSWWTSSEEETSEYALSNAYIWQMYSIEDDAMHYEGSKSQTLSVRCVKDL
ncbi:MAG: fibrobacter succinogenes major paralogous domain-containing protein [Fibromonadaceae bacterium]|nr:fibrobacter succinogenes major paralogous domain-containing protein [Fibromonadaceae bacterium]